MINSGAFEEAFKRLNENQRAAVETIEGPVMVIAGPGTGKTQVLTLRIANILKKTDTSPSSILALTFTEAATREMKERLVKLIGRDGYLVQISTFHSFCQSVIQDNPDKFIISEEAQALTDLERVEVMHKIINDNEFEIVKPSGSPLYYVDALSASIKQLKREGVSPEKLLEVVDLSEQRLEGEKDEIKKGEYTKRKKDGQKNRELVRVYQLYQEEIRRRGRFDFEDMVNMVVNGFEKDEELLLTYQEKLNYLLVDEYQDTNSAQNKLIFNLASFWGKNANIFAVGDPNQSIFRFQGAALENIQEFILRFPNLTLINLNENYRSSQIILNSAAAVIGNNKNQFEKLKNINLSAKSGWEDKQVRIAEFNSSILEDYFIGRKIKQLLNKGTLPEEIAIIARQNQELQELYETLRRMDIPLRIEGGDNVLSTPLVRKVIKLLKVIEETPLSQSESELFTLLNYDFWGFDSFEVLKIAQAASKSRMGLVEYISEELDETSEFWRFIERLAEWKKLEANQTFPDFFQEILAQAGILNSILKAAEAPRLVNQIDSLFEEIKKQTQINPGMHLKQFLKNLEMMEKQKIKISEAEMEGGRKAVTLTTAHKSKGLEWQSVFIYRCIDGKWGNSKNRELIKLPKELLEFGEVEEIDPNEEERRLFYVALTRAKKDIYVSFAKEYSSSYGTKAALPSLFIEEIPEDHKRKLKTNNSEGRRQKAIRLLITPVKQRDITDEEKAYLKELLKNYKLSVTGLNTYLECPYKFKLNDLYRVPRSKESYLAFGTAIHKALELFHKHLMIEKKVPEKSFLVDEFNSALRREILTEEEQKQRQKQGETILSAYYDHYYDQFSPAIATEKHFGRNAYSRAMLEDIALTGKVDRIEAVDKNGLTVRVVDYKTGQPKTRNEIEGKTKAANGAYKRQLIFYRLLADLDDNFKAKVVETELDFVEPDKSGKFRKERFTITEEEVTELKEVIKTTMAEIRSLVFPKAKDTSVCQRCEFKDHCWEDGVPTTVAEQLELIATTG